ncbi:MAG TPA: type II toxin-antitoxin system VapC family toxin [Longimicrobium sp.]|nr:type II toxin-antitoxin system VapC family toxin [Longimicrobium sp.]
MSSTTSGVFWDASALVKAYADEDGTPNVRGALGIENVWGFVTDFVALEVIAALGKKRRSGQITARKYRSALKSFRHELHNDFDRLVVEEHTVQQSHQLAEKYRMLGTSAMDLLHLASAHQAAALCHPRPLVMLCADKPLIEAARAEGLGVYNPETHPHAALRSALSLR